MGPCVLSQTQKTYEKGTRGISWGPLLTQGPRAVPEFPNGQSAPGPSCVYKRTALLPVEGCGCGNRNNLHAVPQPPATR
ncbi:unnamed protein product [Staurois parvus]|uniref:Uncharacterized protein n=1 Tax=Staurois parvus TaxID=386267 RepID=A0ABN9EVB4_9NEOB|nr:unnamed protein product [Staurois parvus]